ncbi:uncharacterized protein LOC112270689 [Brachypodium distachyon]|uniref:uncharacterized protein LOC112270689 n=1 Tax=Brachypodium distachyon TaxID=15368 RepID=UPI000D0DB62A|nr:uncharacterized protein LOC112270689 [Brachypodium distachyon]|eukprot:XP_024314480.1 uncharacterized protein LOC112270689 [Brachypodium distachyon]
MAVTPLHIASAILSASPALLLLRSSNVNTDAVRLCLGAALDRLPVVTTSNAHHVVPAPSNAFRAALRRARRRRPGRCSSVRIAGSAAGGGNGKLIERLAASVLVDPSVDRAAVASLSSVGLRRQACSRAGVADHAVVSVSLDTTTDHPPHPVVKEISTTLAVAGGRQLQSLGNFRPLQPVLPADGSESQASQAKSETAEDVVSTPTTATVSRWLRHYHDRLLSRPTHRCNLQMQEACRKPKFTELTAQNLKLMCGALELCVPWHRAIVPGISAAVLRCRSGMTRWERAKPTSFLSPRMMSTWLLFGGRDDDDSGNLVARELARLVFGSYRGFTVLQVPGNSCIITPMHSCKPVA